MGKDIENHALELDAQYEESGEPQDCSGEAWQEGILGVDIPGGDCSSGVQLPMDSSIGSTFSIDMGLAATFLAPSMISESCKSRAGGLGGQDVQDGSEAKLDDLPIELLGRLLRSAAEVGADTFMHLAATSTRFQAASKTLLQDDPTVLRTVRQNQSIFMEIQVQLARERNRFQRPKDLLTQRWTNQLGSPSMWKIMFQWPMTFPYFPSFLCCIFAFFITLCALHKLQACDKIGEYILWTSFICYGGVYGFIGVFCLLYMCLSYQTFLVGMSVLFNMLLVTHGWMIVSTILAIRLGGYSFGIMTLGVSFALSLWMLLKHMWADFVMGVHKTNVIGSQVFCAFLSIYVLTCSKVW